MPAPSQTIDSTVDRGIERKIAAALKKRQVPSLRNLRIDVHRGKVTLQGEVYSIYEKHLGYQSAAGVDGVAVVVNRLEVVPAPKGYGHKDKRLVTAIAAGVALVIVSGVTAWALSNRSDRPPVFAVTGQVLVDGKAAPGAMVVCYPKLNVADGPRPKGTVDRKGRFQLTTYEPGDGAPAGDYVVTVEWPQSIGKGEDARFVDIVLPEFRSPKTSKLVLTVSEQAVNQVRLSVRGTATALRPTFGSTEAR